LKIIYLISDNEIDQLLRWRTVCYAFKRGLV
jgi:hypothetical protein